MGLCLYIILLVLSVKKHLKIQAGEPATGQKTLLWEKKKIRKNFTWIPECVEKCTQVVVFAGLEQSLEVKISPCDISADSHLTQEHFNLQVCLLLEAFCIKKSL